MVKASRRESGDLASIPVGAETLCSPSALLRGTEPVSALTSARFYIAALSGYNYFFLDFVSGDLALTGL